MLLAVCLALEGSPSISLPQPIRLKAKRLIEEMLKTGVTVHDNVERVIRELNRSELLDPEAEDAEQVIERARRLKLLESLYQELFRARRGTSSL